ncbi:MAG: oxygen-dependent coproporphyrinogen oxidase [Myxococcota bacterium]|nr:oxygen-dependent coproporphyrinogen oxidase [Myxococcota bacterium]
MAVRPSQMHELLRSLQSSICTALEDVDGQESFVEDPVHGPGGALSAPRVLAGGRHIERAGVNFTHSVGSSLPPAATTQRPELTGRGFEAVSLSLIVHPRNPYAPTTHANFRCFVATKENEAPVWWFGGGYDLTPYYGFDEDAVHFHQTARGACDPFGSELYPRFKKACDAYFFLPHRQEARGIGGVFFDDFRLESWARSVEFMAAIGESFTAAYLPILTRRIGTKYGERERNFQLMRRGRYVEFNLLYDRGTKYGIQSGRRIEAVMCSMPPMVSWAYDAVAEPGSPEAQLAARYLRPRDWADMP